MREMREAAAPAVDEVSERSLATHSWIRRLCAQPRLLLDPGITNRLLTPAFSQHRPSRCEAHSPSLHGPDMFSRSNGCTGKLYAGIDSSLGRWLAEDTIAPCKRRLVVGV